MSEKTTSTSATTVNAAKPVNLHEASRWARVVFDAPVTYQPHHARNLAESLEGLDAINLLLAMDPEDVEMGDNIRGGLLAAQRQLVNGMQCALEDLRERAQAKQAKGGEVAP